VDAIITTPSTRLIPIVKKKRLALFFAPPISENIRRKDIGNYPFKIRDLDPDEDYEQKNEDDEAITIDDEEYDGEYDYVNLNRIPHSLFCTFGGINHPVKTHIVFPNLYIQQRREGKPMGKAYMDWNDQRTFINNIVIPAVEKVMPSACFNKLPTSYSHDTGQKIKNYSSHFLPAARIDEIVEEMRKIIKRHELLDFSSFYFVTTAFGGKQFFEKADLEILKVQDIADGEIDWSKLDSGDVLVDLGVNVLYESVIRTTSFFKSPPSTFVNKFFDINRSKN
jgi:hypothetical protein